MRADAWEQERGTWSRTVEVCAWCSTGGERKMGRKAEKRERAGESERVRLWSGRSAYLVIT